MFIVNLKYTLGLDLSSVEKFITEHRKCLDTCYDKGYFIRSYTSKNWRYYFS